MLPYTTPSSRYVKQGSWAEMATSCDQYHTLKAVSLDSFVLCKPLGSHAHLTFQRCSQEWSAKAAALLDEPSRRYLVSCLMSDLRAELSLGERCADHPHGE